MSAISDIAAGEGGRYTSAGTASAIDLCLQLVREDWGAEVANTIARRMVVAPHPEGGQAQYIEQPMPRSDDVDADLRAVLDWLLGNLHRQHTVNDLARRAAMTPGPSSAASRPPREPPRCSGSSPHALSLIHI